MDVSILESYHFCIASEMNALSKTCIVLGLFVFLSGCARLSVKTETWSLTATSFCKDIQVPRVDVVDGNIHVEGYKSEVDIAAIKAAVESAVGQAVGAGFAMLLEQVKK